MRLAILSLCATLAAAQPTLNFAHVESPEGRTEIAKAIGSFLDKGSTVEEVASGVVIHGNDSSMAIGEWLFQKLDGGAQSSQLPVPGPGNELVSVYYPSQAKSPDEMARTAIAVRAAGDIPGLVFVKASNAVVMRASSDRIKLAEWLLVRLDGVQSPTADYQTITERGREYAVRVFYPGSNPDRASLDEIVPAIRAMTDSPVVLATHTPDAIVWRGPATRSELAAWLFHELDQPSRQSVTHEYRQLTDAEDNIARVFYAANADTPEALRALATTVRTASRVMRLQIMPGARALVLRGSLEQVALAERAIAGTPPPAPSEAPKTFEVASVKPSAADSDLTSHRRADGFEMRGQTLISYIAMAYSLPGVYLVKGPDWLDTARFDISAKAAVPISEDQLRVMLQALLADRFHLAAHQETQSLPGYALVVAKGGLKVHAVEKSPTPPPRRAHTIHNLTLQEASFQDLAAGMVSLLGCPIDDSTHVEGVFNFDLKWTPDATQLAAHSGFAQRAQTGDGPSLFDVLESQVGVRLEKRKLPAEILVVDRVDKVPVRN